MPEFYDQDDDDTFGDHDNYHEPPEPPVYLWVKRKDAYEFMGELFVCIDSERKQKAARDIRDILLADRKRNPVPLDEGLIAVMVSHYGSQESPEAQKISYSLFGFCVKHGIMPNFD